MTYVSFRRLKRRAGVPAMNFQSLFLEEKALNLHKIPPGLTKTHLLNVKIYIWVLQLRENCDKITVYDTLIIAYLYLKTRGKI